MESLSQCLVQSRYSGPVIIVITLAGACTPTPTLPSQDLPRGTWAFQGLPPTLAFLEGTIFVEKKKKKAGCCPTGPQVTDLPAQGHLDLAVGPQPCLIA